MSFTFSRQWEAFLPGWLRSGPGRDFVDTIGLVGDAVMEGIYQARYGILSQDDDAPPDAIPLLARDRRIPAGFFEAPSDYLRRISNWKQIWARSGRVRTLMNAVADVWGPTPPRMRVVREFGWANGGTRRARWTTRETNGTFSTHVQSPSNWDWDGQRLPHRAFLIIYAPSSSLSSDTEGTYGDFASRYGEKRTRPDGVVDKRVIGSNSYAEYVSRTIATVEAFKPASVLVPYVIIAFDPDSFDPESPAGTPGMPDGTWGRYSKPEFDVAGNVLAYVPARLATARYWRVR